MREILFRGKGNKKYNSGDWYEGFLTRYSDGEYQIKMGYENAGVTRTVIEETIGQYTGLTDKNGVKIFEGDIVSNPVGMRASVEIVNGVTLPFTNSEITLFNVDECEVIGNIHDNPELIKGKAVRI